MSRAPTDPQAGRRRRLAACRIFGARSAVILAEISAGSDISTRASGSSVCRNPLSPTSTMRAREKREASCWRPRRPSSTWIVRVATEDLGGHRTAVPVAEQGEGRSAACAPTGPCAPTRSASTSRPPRARTRFSYVARRGQRIAAEAALRRHLRDPPPTWSAQGASGAEAARSIAYVEFLSRRVEPRRSPRPACQGQGLGSQGRGPWRASTAGRGRASAPIVFALRCSPTTSSGTCGPAASRAPMLFDDDDPARRRSRPCPSPVAPAQRSRRPSRAKDGQGDARP